jgi:enoyl-CoA hydratase/carnithine racemase
LTSAAASSGISVRTVERVRVIVLDRPERRNALGSASMRALDTALRDAADDPAVGAAVLAGGPPAFCAGSDLKELGRLDVAGMQRHEAETAAVARSIGFLQLPVVAAVEGYALGGGFILAASCDVVVTASDVRWHLPEVANGWLPPWGLEALVARVGPVRARQLVWGVAAVDGTEAHRLGIADMLAAPGSALESALALATGLAALPRPAARSAKRFFEAFAAAGGERLDALSSRMFGADCASAEARATLSRFAARD